MSTINRSGCVSFYDASLSVWEDPGRAVTIGGEWERKFKHDVFLRIVQQLNRLGWQCEVPAEMIKQYSLDFARNNRYCRKGDLQADLRVSGRCIEFKMFQNVNAPERPDNGGRYQYDKERHMPYLLRLEMERTRRRIRDYLCNVFDGYTFSPPDQKLGFLGLTAVEMIEHGYRNSCHTNETLGRPDGDRHCGNNKAKDGGIIEHGARVWTIDSKGRVIAGIAYYNINSMWWVVTGKYSRENKSGFEIFTRQPDDIRAKRNGRLRRKRLENELSKAIKAMNFERAAVLRDLLFRKNERLFVVWHEDHKLYHCANFSGYTKDVVDAGKFTAEEVKRWACAPNKVVPLEAVGHE